MTAPTLTCEHCDSEIDVAKEPHCVQRGGMGIICEACRQMAWERWNESMAAMWEAEKYARDEIIEITGLPSIYMMCK